MGGPARTTPTAAAADRISAISFAECERLQASWVRLQVETQGGGKCYCEALLSAHLNSVSRRLERETGNRRASRDRLVSSRERKRFRSPVPEAFPPAHIRYPCGTSLRPRQAIVR